MVMKTGPIYDYNSMGNGTSATFKLGGLTALPVDFIVSF